jgi:hypothetical protein
MWKEGNRLRLIQDDEYDEVGKVDILGTHLQRKRLLFWEYRLERGRKYIGLGEWRVVGDCIGI